jgi:hypothetical protein
MRLYARFTPDRVDCAGAPRLPVNPARRRTRNTDPVTFDTLWV